MKCYVLVQTDLELDETVEIAKGLLIRPMASELSIFDLAALGARGFQEWPILGPILERCGIEVESEGVQKSTDDELDALNRVWLLSTIMMHQYVAIDCIATSNYSWDHFSDLHKKGNDHLKDAQAHILDFHREIITLDRRETVLSGERLGWIKKSFSVYEKLAASDPRFMTALLSSVNWRYTRSPRLAIASLWAGIESLFAIGSELVFRIALYSANILETKSEERKRVFEHVKQLYSRRSKAVHGDPLNEEELIKTMNDSFGLLSRLLLAAVSDGSVFSKERIDLALFGSET